MKRCAPLILAAVIVGSPALAADPADALLEARLEAHITFLADDLLRGRQPGTAGYEIAARYVASQFRQLGLEPAGTDGSYFQPVPLRRVRVDEKRSSLRLERRGRKAGLKRVRIGNEHLLF